MTKAGTGKVYPERLDATGVFIRFGRYRFREGCEAEGYDILTKQAASLRSAEGCDEAWIAQGQHPSTEFIVVARFRDEASLRAFEGRMRSDPRLGGEFFTLLRLTTQPPEATQYELRDTR